MQGSGFAARSRRRSGHRLGVTIALAAVILAASLPARAQQVTCTDPPFTGPFPPTRTCTVSTSAHTTATSETLPGATAPGQPVLTGQLQQALAGPSGAAIQGALAGLGVLGPVSAATLVGTQTSTEVSPNAQLTIGPGTILIGPGQGTTFFVAPGTSNVNLNTHTETFILDTFQASQPLTNRGVNYLLGDLHATFQTTLVDGSFRFMSGLLSRGSEDGGAFTLLPSAPMAFASAPTAAAPFGDALAYAAKAPGMPVTAAMGDGWRGWIRGSYGRATFDGTAANFGFRDRTASVEGGVEREAGRWLYGAAFGFGQSRVTPDATGDRGDIDTVRIGAYGGYRNGAWSLTGAVAAGFSKIDAARLTLFPSAATSSYDAATVAAGFEAARRFQMGAVRIEPLAGLAYTALRTGPFTETGTTFFDLRGDRAGVEALKGYAGGRLSSTYVAANGWSWTPEVRGRVLYDFLDDRRGYTARFIADPAATPIPVTGLQPNRTAVMLGGALTARFAPGWRAFASYDAELRGNALTHIASAGLRASW